MGFGCIYCLTKWKAQSADSFLLLKLLKVSNALTYITDTLKFHLTLICFCMTKYLPVE